MYHSEHAQFPTEISGKITVSCKFVIIPRMGKVPEISLFLSNLIYNVEYEYADSYCKAF